MPASSKMDPPLAKAKPISDDGSVSVITYLRQGEKVTVRQQLQPERGVRICESLFLKDCTPGKGPMLEQFMKNCSPWEGLTLEKFMQDCLPWEGPHAGAGEECEESSP